MRLFLAIVPTDTIKKEIDNQLFNFKKEYPQFNWTPVDNYHITLHFFGDVENKNKVIDKLEEIMFDQESFYLYAFKADMFAKHKITMYINFRRQKNLEEIVKRVKNTFYLPEQRLERYVPHLTFANFRIPSKQQYFVMKKRLSKIDIDISFPVKKLYLFESILGGKLPVYKKISSITL